MFLANKALSLMLTVASIPAVAQVSAAFRGGVNLSRQHSQAIVDNVPVSIRNVPIHPDDTYVSRFSAGIINNQALYQPFGNANLRGQARFTAGALIEAGPFEVLVGPYGTLNGGYSNSITDARSVEAIERRNYVGAVGTQQRGVGTALTYYRLKTDEPTFGFGALGRVSATVHRKESNGFETRVFAEYDKQLSRTGLVIENGWDRYDKLEALSQNKVATIQYQYQKVGVEFVHQGWFFRIFGGNEKPFLQQNYANTTVRSQIIFGFEVEGGLKIPHR